MPRQYEKFSPDFREDAVRLVLENSQPIAQKARELGIDEGTQQRLLCLVGRDNTGRG